MLEEEDDDVAAELSRDKSIHFPEEQDETQPSFTQEAGTDATKKRKPLSQEEIRRLDKYAQCPHCSVVNVVAGNLKVHWEYQQGHPEHKYSVEDVWIFERERGSTRPRKRRTMKGSAGWLMRNANRWSRQAPKEWQEGQSGSSPRRRTSPGASDGEYWPGSDV